MILICGICRINYNTATWTFVDLWLWFRNLVLVFFEPRSGSFRILSGILNVMGSHPIYNNLLIIWVWVLRPYHILSTLFLTSFLLLAQLRKLRHFSCIDICCINYQPIQSKITLLKAKPTGILHFAKVKTDCGRPNKIFHFQQWRPDSSEYKEYPFPIVAAGQFCI